MIVSADPSDDPRVVDHERRIAALEVQVRELTFAGQCLMSAIDWLVFGEECNRYRRDAFWGMAGKALAKAEELREKTALEQA